MTYELCKSLKDAGFPQTCDCSYSPQSTEQKIDNAILGKDTGYVDVPTLSEIIEAITADHITLEMSVHKDGNKKWCVQAERIKSSLSQALTEQHEKDLKVTRKLRELYGAPNCDYLHHKKEDFHDSWDACPVENKINNLLASLDEEKK